MRMKLAALLLLVLWLAAGCSSNSNTGTANMGNDAATTNARTANTATTGNAAANNTSAAPEVAKADENMVHANANSSETVGGTKEGCKCSAAGMSCNHKEGEKGCCGGKDGSCATMKEGKSSCCAMDGKGGKACCSAAGKVAQATGAKEAMPKM